jgi:hypothetical protein
MCSASLPPCLDTPQNMNMESVPRIPEFTLEGNHIAELQTVYSTADGHVQFDGDEPRSQKGV